MAKASSKRASKGDDGKAEGPEDDQPMSFFDHLAELRARLVRATMSLVAAVVVCYVFVDELTQALLEPFSDAWANHQAACKIPENNLGCLPTDTPYLQNLSPFEAVLVDIRIALVFGLFVAAPVIFYQLWMFISPGLYRREKRMVIPFAATSAVMFAIGGWFCYTFVLPFATEWLLGYGMGKDSGTEGGVQILAQYTYTDHITYTTRLLLGFGLIFEFPLAVFFLAAAGMITHKTLIRHWKIMVLSFFVVGAFLTPPEPVSQLMMALPLCGLYGISIGVAYIVGKPERERVAKLEAELADEQDD
ncbi:twin-arginine translocase subunit TatC [Paraliomyxa miuraensis]|uniref:twin-arginine translocase subunit TatC n=1 Tax=Paraliomyxa miuraensis TaxID=376150 RepID=UPI00225042C1|nr:twin-arginine translocase subunit TatC [Paraliomyxa miuraensis]MCX4242776.1 twin-arginine translocase subunit TatC [Paraliomyxa miuraensis]